MRQNAVTCRFDWTRFFLRDGRAVDRFRFDFWPPEKAAKNSGASARHQITRRLLLQSIGYALAWIAPRPNFAPIVPMPKWAEIAVAAAGIVLAALSLWLMWRAIIVLGKQWGYVARIIEGHTLITEGPYNLVRNPIYTGMFGILIATGLAASRWPMLIAAILFFLCGTWVRVHREENLLRQSFGAEFEVYRSRVPALIPWLF